MSDLTYSESAPASGPPPCVGTRPPGRDQENPAVAGRSVAAAVRRRSFPGVLVRSSPPPGGGPAAGAPVRLHAAAEPGGAGVARRRPLEGPPGSGLEPLGRLVAKRPTRPKARR